MAGVSEVIVKEYFETLGFMVNQPCKYVVSGRRKLAEDELDLVVFNPLVTEQVIPDHLLWKTEDLAGITRAVVAVRGWHSERFSKKLFETAPEILRFAEEATVRVAGRKLGSTSVAKILCLAELPASEDLKQNTLDMLKSKGIDGVLLFRTILQHLVVHVDRNKNYERSDLQQTIRIFKSYNMLKNDQMDLFEKKARKQKVKAEG